MYRIDARVQQLASWLAGENRRLLYLLRAGHTLGEAEDLLERTAQPATGQESRRPRRARTKRYQEGRR